MTYRHYRRRQFGSLATNKTPDETRRDISYTFEKWGIEEYRVHPSRRDGRLVSEAQVEFYVNEKKQLLRCARFSDYRTNLRAVYLILESLRLAAERGILDDLARAAVALLPPGSVRRPAHEVLGIAADAPLEVAEAAYRALARSRHPDTGGSEEAMVELNEAIEAFRLTKEPA